MSLCVRDESAGCAGGLAPVPIPMLCEEPKQEWLSVNSGIDEGELRQSGNADLDNDQYGGHTSGITSRSGRLTSKE